MRDWWWQRCAQARHVTVDAGLAQKIDELQAAMLQGQKRQDEVLSSVKTLVLQQLSVTQQQVMTSGTLSGVLEATSSLASGLPPVPFVPMAISQPTPASRSAPQSYVVEPILPPPEEKKPPAQSQ